MMLTYLLTYLSAVAADCLDM